MDEINKLLAENLIEALRQIQAYLVLAIGASATAFALALKPQRSAEDEVEVPGISLPLPRSAAHLLLWILGLVGGFMAGVSAHRAKVIADKLTTVPKLLEAIGTFPSIATSSLLLVRFIAVYLPAILSAFAVSWQARREKASVASFVVLVIITFAAYFPLWGEIAQLIRLMGTPN
jgi:hypothetical protein